LTTPIFQSRDEIDSSLRTLSALRVKFKPPIRIKFLGKSKNAWGEPPVFKGRPLTRRINKLPQRKILGEERKNSSLEWKK